MKKQLTLLAGLGAGLLLTACSPSYVDIPETLNGKKVVDITPEDFPTYDYLLPMVKGFAEKSHFSKTGFEGYLSTYYGSQLPAQAPAYMAENAGVKWEDNAKRLADALKGEGIDDDSVRRSLTEAGFTEEEITFALSN